MPHIVHIAFWVLFLTACGTSNTSVDASDSELMGLDDQSGEPVWIEWSADVNAPAVPGSFVEEISPFDYWQIDDAELVDEGWAGAAALLDYVRRDGLSEAQKETATALLQALDGEQTRMDVTFVVTSDDRRSAEGLVVRIHRELEEEGAVVAASIFIERDESQANDFDRAYLWARGGFEEAEPFTLALEHRQQDWQMYLFEGMVYPAPEGADSPFEEEPALVRDILAKRFWAPFAGPAFVEATSRAEDESALPEPLEPALGLQLREREIEQVYEETAFPPRMDSSPF